MSAADLLRRVVCALDAALVPHMLVGSFASSSHGAPRSTQDIDLVIDPTPEALDAFVAAFEGDDAYLDRWAAELGVTELLARARAG